MKKLTIMFIVSLISIVVAISILSINRVDFVSFDDILEKKAWIVYASYSGKSQQIIGTFSSEELNRKRGPNVGEKVKNDFQISISLDEFTCEYPIQIQDEYVWDYDYEYKQLVLDIGAKEFIEECTSKHPDWNKWGKGKCIEMCPPAPLPCIITQVVCDWYCLWRTPKARYGRILDPRTHFSATVTLSSNGETYSSKIDSYSSTSTFVDDIAYISWEGYLGTDEECPTAQARGISAMFYNLEWILIDSDKYEDYKNFDISACFRDTATGRITFDECISQHDSLANKVLSPIRFSYYFKDIDESSTARVEDGVVIMDVPKLLKFPTFVIRIDADWLGVVVPKGKPKIVDVFANPLQSGSEGSMSIKIKNIGDGVGTFDVSISCESPIKIIESPIRLSSVGVGEIREAFVRLYATSDKPIVRECTITVYEVEDPTLKDTTKTMVEVKPMVQCFIEGQRRCNVNVIEECKNGKWVKITTCEYGCEIVDNTPKCKIPKAVCGNRVCEYGENAINCPQDCKPICGNRVCEPTEDYRNCPQDCKHPCQITCPPFDINCYNRIINCWVSEITKSIQLILTLIGIFVVIILFIYVIIKSKGWLEEWQKSMKK